MWGIKVSETEDQLDGPPASLLCKWLQQPVLRQEPRTHPGIPHWAAWWQVFAFSNTPSRNWTSNGVLGTQPGASTRHVGITNWLYLMWHNANPKQLIFKMKLFFINENIYLFTHNAPPIPNYLINSHMLITHYA